VYLIRFLLFCSLITSVQAQPRDIGLLGGGGWLNSVSIRGGLATPTAGFSPGITAGAVLGQDLYEHWSGEIRYLFEERDARLKNGSTTSEFAGQAHVVHYDVIFHAKPRRESLRPYLAVGGGIKLFRGTGSEMAYRPLMEYAYLTRTSEMKPMLVVGAGVRFSLGRRLIARIDFSDQITGFPTKVIAPAPGMAIGGMLHDFVPAIGLSWVF
jgi:hypothetical protein